MQNRVCLISTLLFLSCLVAVAKDKQKVPLPIDVLQAHTAWVIVDPQAGLDIRDPNANNVARASVESALAKWGRLSLVTDPSMADLIIAVRKGNGKAVQPTISGTPVNGPPPVIAQRTGSGIGGAGRTGPAFEPSDPPDPHPQLEAGDAQDMFAVYRGNHNRDYLGNPLDSAALWRYTAKDALTSPGVPAVDAFRKAIAESEKELAKH
jgi:hypothetical protein